MDGRTENQNDRRLYGQTDGKTDGRMNERKYYATTQGIWTHGLWLHALRAITEHALLSPKIDADTQTDIRTYNIDWPHWGPLDPSLGDKCIATLDPYTGNSYKYKNQKIPVDDQTDGKTEGRTYMLYCQSGDLNPWPADECPALFLPLIYQY